MVGHPEKARIDGAHGETIIGDTLRSNGYDVYWADDWWQSGDMMFFSPEDDLGFGDGKSKAASTYTYTQVSEDHGIDKRQFDRYSARCRKNNIDGFVVVYERDREIRRGERVPSDKVLIFRLQDKYRENTSTALYGRGGMVYWRRSDAIAEYDAVHS